MLKTNGWVAAAAVALTLAAGARAMAQSSEDREAEAAQAAAEDEAAKKADSDAIYTDFSGKVHLFTKDEQEGYDDPSVVGLFVIEKKVYLIKLETTKIMDDLKQFDGKSCVVSAKIRNQGKYLVVRKVVLNGAGYNFTRRRGGVGM
jgi:hypothetical protein